MRLKPFRLVCVLFCALLPGAIALPAGGQSAVQSTSSVAPLRVDLGSSTVALTDWKFHPGDSPQANVANAPRWAQPGYEDSGWTTMDMRGYVNSHDPNYSSETFVPGWTARGFPTLTGFAWYRTRFRVAGNNRDLWLAMSPDVDDAYQVYANGKLVGAFGTFTPRGVRALAGRSMKFHLPPPDASGNMLLALRFYMQPDTPLWNPRAGGLHGWPVVGLASTIALIQSRNSNISLKTFLIYLLLGIVLIMAGIAALWIYLIDRREKAYLWLTLALLTGAAEALNEFAGDIGHGQRVSLTQILLVRDFATTVLAPVFWILFWACWFRLRQLRMVFRIAWGLALAEVCVLACMRHYLLASWLPVAWAHPVLVASIVLRFAVALLLVAVVVAGIRQESAEGWIALPAIVLLGIALFTDDLEVVGVQVVYFPLGIAVNLNNIAWLVLAVVVIGLVLRRFLHTQVQEQELQREMEQARQVQSMLVPVAPANTPGFTVESVYIPASEVGGDFFQILPGEDGSLLIVVGDVSGKGLKAAMTVSTIVGALRNESSRQPAEILTRLDHMLHGQVKGFVTCCAALISADGTMTIANAGHIPPYRNGEAVPVDSSLPLGVVAENSYVQSILQLAADDCLTFVSDGVVEARNVQGELYGFDRTRSISSQSAESIVNAAKQFGQEDDITVVKVAYVGTAVLMEATHAI